jgi:YYY domain-containing protein
MQEILAIFLRWYIVIQLISLAALPLTLRLFPALPDRGYAFAKSLGVLLVGFVLWLGTSYGFLRNETGGAWLALLIVAILSGVAGWPILQGWLHSRRQPAMPTPDSQPASAQSARNTFPRPGYILLVEAIFLLGFIVWTWVRAHDPAINHTEQPMDLMFMSGIWTSPTFPPRDPWLAGYAISYYYFGYWLLVTVARLAAQPPEIAYNIGQACWFGLLLVGSFGVGYNLWASGRAGKRESQGARTEHRTGNTQHGILAGLLTAVAVAITGNLHVILEWLYAQGVNVDGLARWARVYNFPENAQVTRQWFIDAGWSWWWRSSRVIQDTDLFGNHIEVIAEFPIFSYVLGDNHPHVLAMPIVLLAVALALNIFLQKGLATADWGLGGEEKQAPNTQSPVTNPRSLISHAWIDLLNSIPGRGAGLLLLVVAVGALAPINTWDFPPYWMLLSLVAFFVVTQEQGIARGLASAALLSMILLAGLLIAYFPYFLTAQSQAGGLLPNYFNPTRLPQFLLMFGHFLLGVGALIRLAWREQPTQGYELIISLLLVLGLPLLFLFGTMIVAVNSEAGLAALGRMALPPELNNYTEAILGRWGERPFTFLLTGTLSALVIALLWRRWRGPEGSADPRTTFALLLAGIGLLLIFAPEFIYLRDNFGTRMNTVFKFYYQGWLLLGISSSYAIVTAFSRLRLPETRPILAAALGSMALLLILAGLIYPVAGAYAKVRGFGTSTPTLNGLAYVSADERSAIEWIRRNTAPTDLVLQGKGRSYWATDNRINAATGRPTLLGWDGHQSQWRGSAYGEMAAGRPELVETIYRTGSPQIIQDLLRQANISYVYVGPVEREQYGISPAVEARLQEAMDLAFAEGNIHIYRRRG